MDISYRNELIKEPTSRARMALSSLAWIFPEGGALDRLTDERNVPAAKVLVELDDLLAREGSITRREVDEHREVLEAFRKIVVRHVEQERADKIADKLARQILKAGLGYRGAQSLFVRALDRMKDVDWPDEGGW